MQAARHFPLGRAVLVLLFFCGWLIATNHCALGLMAPRIAEEEHSPCASHSTPTDEKPADCPITCCKALQAIQADGVKMAAKEDLFVGDLLMWSEALLGSAQISRPQPELLDIGPPFVFSFAELVLQRSLFGLAPPLA